MLTFCLRLIFALNLQRNVKSEIRQNKQLDFDQ